MWPSLGKTEHYCLRHGVLKLIRNSNFRHLIIQYQHTLYGFKRTQLIKESMGAFEICFNQFFMGGLILEYLFLIRSREIYIF